VTVTATDKDGGTSAAATTGVAITAPSTVTVTTQADPLNTGQTMLVVQGTAGDDVIELDHSQQKVNKVLVQTLTVTSNGVAIYSSTASFSRIQVFANSGNDSVTHGGGFKYAVEEFGGDGNDTLKAGQSGDILVGGAGDDSLASGAGNDVEIGGLGADKIVGDAGQDLLISGYTAYDNDPASLMAISAEWTSADDFATRVAALQAGVGPGGSIKLISDDSPNATVFDDGVKDTLNGGGNDSDWLLYNYSGGGIYDKAAGNTTGDVLQDV
jgi:Ca2+-binding RTX toxin-like protein